MKRCAIYTRTPACGMAAIEEQRRALRATAAEPMVDYYDANAGPGMQSLLRDAARFDALPVRDINRLSRRMDAQAGVRVFVAAGVPLAGQPLRDLSVSVMLKTGHRVFEPTIAIALESPR